MWWKLWNLVEIVKCGGNCEIWWKLWNLVEIVKFGGNCEHLGTFENIWEHLGTSWNTCNSYKTWYEHTKLYVGLDGIGLDHWNTHTLEHRCAVLIKQSIYFNFRQIEFKLRWLLGATKARMVGQCIFPRIMINFNLKVPPSGRKTSLLQRELANPQ